MYQTAIDIDSMNAEWYSLGNSQYELMDYLNSYECYQHAIDLEAKNSRYLRSLLKLHYDCGYSDGVQDLCYKLLKLKPSRKHAAEYYSILAETQYSQGKFKMR